MCGDNPPKPTNIIDIYQRSRLIKLCFNKERSLHSNRRGDHQIPWIVWIPEHNYEILKIFNVTKQYSKNEFKKNEQTDCSFNYDQYKLFSSALLMCLPISMTF